VAEVRGDPGSADLGVFLEKVVDELRLICASTAQICFAL